MSCPWAKIEKPDPVDLAEIMSEEVARNLQAKEDKKSSFSEDIGKGSLIFVDKSLESVGDSEEEVDNIKNRKDWDDSDEEVDILQNRKDWDQFDTMIRDLDYIPGCGYKVKQNSELNNKYEFTNSGRKNSGKLLSFPPEFQRGDDEDFDLKLSNKAFNSLKMYSTGEKLRRHKVHDNKEQQAKAKFGLDQFSLRILYKMINARLLKQVNGVIGIGKEAVILHAEIHPDCKVPIPRECVIKVFKTTLSEYKERDENIAADYRFKDRIGKQNSKETVLIRAEKEAANLIRLQRAGMDSPAVITLKKHILVMTFLGYDHTPAPKLKYAHSMTESDLFAAYEQVIEGMNTLYHKANLIHADLSEYNILWYFWKCYFIDVSQSVEPSHENAFCFLYRDCCNVINFFSRHGASRMTADELFIKIVGCSFTDKVALLSVQKSFQDKDSIPGCSYKVKQNGELNTKYDLNKPGRKMARKLSPEFEMGDDEDFDLELSNKASNSLKMYSNKEQLRRHKVDDKQEDQATAEYGLDHYARIILYKMFNAQLLSRINGVISVGEEAVILHAETNPTFPNAETPLPKECVIKVFKTTLSEYKRDKYIKDDYKLDRIGKQNSKKTFRMCAEKEAANLMRLKRAGLACPEVITVWKHVLVMSFIGYDHTPAPNLKYADMTESDLFDAYEQVIEGMKTLYHKANLIHADLSEYNILWHNRKCYFIDVSQSVEPSHEDFFYCLHRDCCNVINFFGGRGVARLTPDELFVEIVGCAFTDRMALLSVQESFKMKPHLVDKPGVESSLTFDAAWDKTLSGELPKVDSGSVQSSDQLPKVEKIVRDIEET